MKIFREEVLRLALESGLVAFDKEDEVSPAFLHDGAGGFDLGGVETYLAKEAATALIWVSTSFRRLSKATQEL